NGFSLRWTKTHPKSFSGSYYAERLGGYSSTVEHLVLQGLRVVGRADRIVSPDLRDRMAVLATLTDH
ncbi:MAG TPA: hypothetical protein VKV69_13510, partial [Actinomycetota bacterium]|nr:hypothetical protein [Actinomycetota bacterium]